MTTSEPSLSPRVPPSSVGGAASAPRAAERPSRAAVFYMLLPVLLLGASVLGHVVMVSLATRDPGFSLVPDYYQKASNFESELEQRRANQRLGFQITVERFVVIGEDARSGDAILEVRFVDGAGQPLAGVDVGVAAFPVARADQQVSAKLEPSPDIPGKYVAKLGLSRPGLWELAFDAQSKAGRFTSVTRATVEQAGASP